MEDERTDVRKLAINCWRKWDLKQLKVAGVLGRKVGCGRAFLIRSLSLAARNLCYRMKSHLLYEWFIAIVART